MAIGYCDACGEFSSVLQVCTRREKIAPNKYKEKTYFYCPRCYPTK